MDMLDRVIALDLGPDVCWLWPGYVGEAGYCHVGKKKRLAHRAAYERLVGPIPPGHDLDHLCRVHHCVNPAHLEPVTHAENCRRGTGWSGRHAQRTHCPCGREYDIVTPRRRACSYCRAQYQRVRRARLRAA